MIRTQISLTPELKSNIDQATKVTGQSMASFIRKAVEEKVQNTSRAQERDTKELVLLLERLKKGFKKTPKEWQTEESIIAWQREMRKDREDE
jgi:predicted DNA-binding protein